MDCAPPPLPFAGALDRSVVEHCARHPRRRVPHELKGVRPHWVQAKAGRLGEMLDSTVPFSLDAEEALPPPSQPANGDAAAGSTNVRAILVLGRKTPESLRNAAHALHRIEVLAANFHDGTKSLPRAYGGLVAKKKPTDAALVKALKDFIKEQSGIDLSKVTQWTKLVEFQYTDRPTTVFFVPDLSGVGEEGLKARRCCKEVKYEVEVEETVEEGEIEVDGEAQKVTKKRKVKQEKTKQQQVVGPRKTTLGQLLETEAAAGADPQTAELLAAADVLDEWLQRDMATRLCSFLEERHAKFLAEEAEQKEHQEAAEGRKRKREADGESAKRQRKEQQELLQAKWEAEDVSASEQDKSAAQAERDAELQQLAEAESAVLQKLKEQEEADAKAAEEAAKERAEKKKTPVPEGMQLVHVRDWGLFDAFQTFDRPRTGVNHTPQAPHALYQEYLAQCLLALNDGKSLRQCKAMTKRGAGWSFNYHIAAQTDKFVEKKEKKENGDKTAAAAEAEAATAAEGEAAGEGAEGAAGEEPAAEATPAEGEQEGAEGAGEETKQDAAEGEGNAEAEDMEEGEA